MSTCFRGSILLKLRYPDFGYAETFYPEEQTEATGGEFRYARNKKAFVLENKYKIIVHLDSDEHEVYDLRRYPDELNNLTAQGKEVK